MASWGRTRASRVRPIGLTVIAVLAMLLLGALLGALPTAPRAVHSTGNAGLHPFVTPVTSIYVNRSQSSGTYVGEFITLNNSSTLTRIPSGLITVKSATDCRWVTVTNATTASSPISVFHNVQYFNVTAANASGAKTAGQSVTSFKICGGTAVWVNYIYWTFTVYNLVAAGLGGSDPVTVTFGFYPGTTSQPAGKVLSFSNTKSISLTVSSNLSLQIVFQKYVNTSTTCDPTGQICSYTSYKFLSATLAGTTVINTTGTITYGTIGSTVGYAKPGAVYQNWTAGYTNSSIAVNGVLGGFFVATGAAFNTWILNFWWFWFLVVVIAIIASLAWRSSARHRRG